MPAGFARLKVWTDLEILTDEDLNAEFDNILNNLDAINIGGYGDSVPEMQTQLDPGDLGTEVLTDNLAEDIQELRFVIARIIGKDYWYETPDRTLGTETDTSSLVSYFPMNCPDQNTESGFGDIINRGGIINAVSQVGENISEDNMDTTNKKFGNSSFTMDAPTECLAFSEKYGSFLQSSMALHFRNLGASAAILANPLTQMEVKLDSSGLAVFTTKAATAATDSTKNSFTVTGAANRALNSSWQHLAIRFALNGVNGSGTDKLNMLIDAANEGTQLNSQTIPVNGSPIGKWFLNGRLNNPSFGKFSAMSVLPTAEAANAWSLTASSVAGEGTVSSGVLTLNSPAIQTNFIKYERSTIDGGSQIIDLNQFCMDIKMKVGVNNPPPSVTNNPYRSVVALRVRDDSMDRSFKVNFHKNGLAIENNSEAAESAIGYIACDLTRYTHIRLITTGATDPILKVYINGCLEGQFVINDSDVTAGDIVKFGHDQVSSGSVLSYWEYVALYSGAAANSPPVIGGAQGNFDDLVVLKSIITDESIALLSERSGQAVFGSDKTDRLELPTDFVSPQETSSAVSGQNYARIASGILAPFASQLFFASDGKTPIDVSISGDVIFTPADAAHIGCLALSVDGDALAAFIDSGALFPIQTFNNANIAANRGSFCFSRKEVLPIGLHYAESLAAVSVNTSNILIYRNRITAKKA